jgi:hypothetical protein
MQRLTDLDKTLNPSLEVYSQKISLYTFFRRGGLELWMLVDVLIWAVMRPRVRLLVIHTSNDCGLQPFTWKIEWKDVGNPDDDLTADKKQ